MTTRPKLLYFVTEDWYFCSHRLGLALAAQSAGFDVLVVTRVRKHGQMITSCGLRLIPIELARHGSNILSELPVLYRLFQIYRTEKPDIVHHVALKPVLYGSIVGKAAGMPALVNAVTGLGYLFASREWKARLLRGFIKPLLRRLIGNDKSVAILQNPDDVKRLFGAAGDNNSCVRIIRGSGVDLDEFTPAPEPTGTPLIVLAGRMLWDKGVQEFVTAAHVLQQQGITARFALVGASDAGSPSAVAERQLQTWQDDGVIEWWGCRDDMPKVFAQCHIVCLPSYREGVPKVLIEAAACARPIVTTDVPGCREIVRHEENGLLVPPKDAERLAEALRRLIEDPTLRRRFGQRGRLLAEREFGLRKVISETLGVYRELLDGMARSGGSV
ncbi:MAG: glycosyltransferase family 4 protein [Gammaproteobacteria bacterium]